MTVPIFRLTDVSKTFGGRGVATVALDRINLDIPARAFLGIVGTSGAGKSTLLKLLNLLDSPSSGRIEFNGANIAAFGKQERIRYLSKVSTIFQHFNLFHGKTVLENVCFPLSIRGVDKARQLAQGQELIRAVGLDGKQDHYPSQLSGGQKQRVGIARALITRPDVLLCDEATSALDSQTTLAVLALLATLQARYGFTVVMITHAWDVVRQACDSVALIEHGRIQEQGRIADIIDRPHSRLKDHLLPLDDSADGGAGDPETLDLIFRDPQTQTAELSRLANALDISFAIVAGRVERIQGQAIARFRVKFESRDGVAGVARFRQALAAGRQPLPQLEAAEVAL